MAWINTETNLIGGQPIATTSTTKQHPLGTVIKAYDPDLGGGEFIYLAGIDSTAVGEWVSFNYDDGTTALLAAGGIGPVAIAMSANVTSSYGWYQRAGKAEALCAAGFADNGKVYITATGGTCDDTKVAGDLVHNAKGASGIDTDTGTADFEIDHPWVDDILEANS